MDPPQMTHSQVGDGGPSFVASLFELLGIHRNVARGPKEQKESKVKTAAAQTLKEQSKTPDAHRSEEHTSELQSLMRISYAVFCLKKNKNKTIINKSYNTLNISNKTITLIHAHIYKIT